MCTCKYIDKDIAYIPSVQCMLATFCSYLKSFQSLPQETKVKIFCCLFVLPFLNTEDDDHTYLNDTFTNYIFVCVN